MDENRITPGEGNGQGTYDIVYLQAVSCTRFMETDDVHGSACIAWRDEVGYHRRPLYTREADTYPELLHILYEEGADFSLSSEPF